MICFKLRDEAVFQIFQGTDHLDCKSPFTFIFRGKHCDQHELRVCKVGISVDIEVNNRSNLS